MTRADWPVLPLGDVAETALGKMLDAARPKGAIETPYLRNVNVQWGRIDVDDVATVALSEEERERFAVRTGDLLVCEGGAIGRAAIWQGTGEIAYQKALHRVRSRGALDLRWLRYLLEHYDNTGVLASRATGSTIKHLPQAKLRELPVPMPSISEQQRIVDILEDHLSRLDAGSNELSTSSAKLAAFVSASRHATTTAAGTDTVALGDLVAQVEAGRSFGSANRPAEDDEWGIVKVSAMTWGTFQENENKVVLDISRVDTRFEIRPGDLLVSRANTSAYVGAAVLVGPCRPRLLLSDKSLRLVPSAGVDARFLQAALQAPGARRQISALATGTKDSMRNISQAALLSIQVPKASRTEQASIVRATADMESQISQLRTEIRRASQRQRALRRSLLTAAFSGRL